MEDSLTTVRKAYRYIYEYQRKLIDSIQFLTSEYQIINAGPKFSGKPKFNSFKFIHWSWDYLPFYQPLFKFEIAKATDTSPYKELAIYITSDTGHFINEREDSDDRTDLNRFAPCEKSESIVVLMICANDHDFDYQKRIVLNNTLIKDGRENHFELNKVIAKKYSLNVFANENSIIALRNDFKTYVQSVDSKVQIF